jgi:hypothetical protein
MNFYLGGQPVGAFVESPTKPGQYEYEPHRGEGHAKLAASLKDRKAVVCSFTEGWKTSRTLIAAEECIENRWYIQITEIWVRPRSLVLIIAWLVIGISIFVLSRW